MYMKRVRAMDHLLGKTVAASRAVEVALLRYWKLEVFKTDCKFLAFDIVNS